MNKQELWDAVDREGRPLGFDWVRGESMPDGVYHHVVMILTATDRGNVLITQRHPDKTCGLAWEVTAGSVLKGETPLDGAVRELAEETGIRVGPDALHPVFARVWGSVPAIYNLYVARVREDGLSVTLQEGETVDWKLIPYSRFKEMVRRSELPLFPEQFCRRLSDFEPLLDRLILT